MEYRIEQLGNSTRSATEALNDLTKDGWEVVPGTLEMVSNRYVVLLCREAGTKRTVTIKGSKKDEEE